MQEFNLYLQEPNAPEGVCLSAAIALADSFEVSIKSSVNAPIMPLRPAYTLPILFLCLRAVSITPHAVALMTAVTPPDCA